MRKISIIVPVYNVGNYLERCIVSILEQDYQYFELVLIDDGSSDGSEKICDDFAMKDKRIRVIHQENRGVSAARNKGLDVATGEYIGFVDADDEVESDMFSLMVDNVQKYNVDIVGYSTIIKFQDGKIKEMYGTKKVYDCSNIEAMQLFLQGGIIDSAVYDKLFTNKCIQNVRFAEGKRMQEDRLFILQAMMQANRIYIHDESKYVRYERDDSATAGAFKDNWLDIRWIAEEMKNRAILYDKTLTNIAKYNEIKSNVFLYRKMIRCTSKKEFIYEKKELLHFIKEYKIEDCVSYMKKSEKIEIFIIKKISCFYVVFLKLFDLIAK